jgi:hypothetical protein
MAIPSERDVAQSMIILWGKDAAQFAREYALEHERLSNPVKSTRWTIVEQLIAQMRYNERVPSRAVQYCPFLFDAAGKCYDRCASASK